MYPEQSLRKPFKSLLEGHQLQTSSDLSKPIRFQTAPSLYKTSRLLNSSGHLGSRFIKSPVVRPQSHSIPLGIMQKYQDVTLSVDVMKICGIPFLMTISRHIKFCSAGKLDNSMKNETIISHFKVMMGVYCSRDFQVTIISLPITSLNP